MEINKYFNTISSRTVYLHGQKNGECDIYYADMDYNNNNGRLQWKGYFVNDKKEGDWVEYEYDYGGVNGSPLKNPPQANIKKQETYKNGELISSK